MNIKWIGQIGVIIGIIYWLLISALVIMAVPKEIRMPNVSVELIPSKTVVKAGETFSVDVKMTPKDGAVIAGVQLDIGFNTRSLKINSLVEGDLLKQGGTTFFNGGTLDNDLGTVKSIYGVSLGVGKGATAAGIFITLSCTAVNAGTTSAFALSNVIAGDLNAVALPLALQLGQVAVTYSQDFNGDGKVDMADLLTVVAVFNTTGAVGWIPQDLNKDGIINILDMIAVAQVFSV